MKKEYISSGFIEEDGKGKRAACIAALQKSIRSLVRHYYFQNNNNPGKLWHTITSIAEASTIEYALETANNNQIKAANILGISRSCLITKMKKHKNT